MSDLLHLVCLDLGKLQHVQWLLAGLTNKPLPALCAFNGDWP